MNIILKIAWRNVWRNPRRSLVLISSIAVGVFGYMGTTAFSRGFLNQMVDSTIDLGGGHITISARGFHENPNINLFIAEPQRTESVLRQTPGIRTAPLVSLSGMVNSSETAAGAIINGIDPEHEPGITVISRSIAEGRYLGAAPARPEIVVGVELAKKLNVTLGEKIVLMISDLDNNISSGAYRICGLYQVSSKEFEKVNVYISMPEAQKLAGYGSAITACNIRLEDPEKVLDIAHSFSTALEGEPLEVLTWRDRNKLLEMAIATYDYSLLLTLIILFTAIAFSIANAFLMVIYERIQEFGIMMANGVLPRKIRGMLYTETFFITLLGLAMGFVASFTVFGYWSVAGLDLSNFASGLSTFGVGTTIYPAFVTYDIVLAIVVINIIVLASVLYPSIKASRFEVVDAIRFV